MAKKKIKDGLLNNKEAKIKVKKDPAAPKQASVDQLMPKVHNKDSLTENIQSRSSKSVRDIGLGKSQRVPLDSSLKIKKK